MPFMSVNETTGLEVCSGAGGGPAAKEPLAAEKARRETARSFGRMPKDFFIQSPTMTYHLPGGRLVRAESLAGRDGLHSAGQGDMP